MSQSNTPRRVVFVADPATGSWQMGRSSGWSSDAAAQEAVWLLDTDGSSLAVRDFAGFFVLEGGSWVVVRGGIAPPPNPTDRYRREAIALEAEDFARVRFNPFRILPELDSDNFETPQAELPSPEIPIFLGPADDVTRMAELESRSRDRRSELELLLAAILDRDHTLTVGTCWSYDDLELLLLLLPPHLRSQVTFHSQATSLPPDPVPRLVLTRSNGVAFEAVGPGWGHRLPSSAGEIQSGARRAASRLVEQLAIPDRLVEAQEAYGKRASVHGCGPALLAEVQALLRLARRAGRQAPPDEGLRELVEAATVRHTKLLKAGGAETHSEVTPKSLGGVVARHIRSGQRDMSAPAVVMERFFTRRQSHPNHFAEFIQRLDGVLDGMVLPESESGARIRTMLMLLAASRRDTAGVADAIVAPAPRDLIARLGGVEAWVPSEDDSAAGEAVRALATVEDAEGADLALHALAEFSRSLPDGPPRDRVEAAAFATVRGIYRQLSPERWETTVAIGAKAFDRFQAGSQVAAGEVGEVSHQGLGAVVSSDPDLRAVSDADLFRGFLGFAGSPCSLARPAITTRGDALVDEVVERIRRPASDGAAAEAAHWSLYLIDRVRRRQTDAGYLRLAARLLRVAAPPGASAALGGYFMRYPEVLAWLFDQAELRANLESSELTRLYVNALADELGEAERTGEGSGFVALCQRMRATGFTLEEDVLLAGLGTRLSAPVEPASKDPEKRSVDRSILYDALSGMVALEAQVALRSLLRMDGAADAASPAGVAGAQETGATLVGRAELAGASGLRVGARRLLFAAASVVVLIVAGAGLMRSSSRAAARSAAQIERERITGELAEGRQLAGMSDWQGVVALLSQRTPPDSLADAFAWDSLLAVSALRQAQGVASSDTSRTRLLSLAIERSSRALVLAAPFAPGTDVLRLVRAEACLAGDLPCQKTDIREDLILAMRSSAEGVSRRAQSLLAEQE